MQTNALENLGLTHNEALVYITLSKTGPLPVGGLSRHMDLHRSRIYDSLEHLEKKGLVTVAIINKTQHFAACEPSALFDVLDQHRSDLQKLMPHLQETHTMRNSSIAAATYVGVGGVKAALSETLRSNYVVFGAPKESLAVLGESFWKNYNEKLSARKIKTRMLFNEDLRLWAKQIAAINPHHSIRFLPNHFDALTETMVLDDAVYIFIWTQTPTATVISDSSAAKSYKQLFDLLWTQAAH